MNHNPRDHRRPGRRSCRRRMLCLLAMLLPALPVAAVPTDITVRVLSRDAKFVGTSMQGAAIVISDADTGEVLAEGVTRGGTGDTGTIIVQPRQRGARLSDDDTAAFTTRLDLQAPRRLRVSATGPLEPAHAAQTVTAEQWVLPGRHLTGGDGWVLDMPGFAVAVLAPADGARIEVPSGTLVLSVYVGMMCGCPLTPGGLWDSDGFELLAQVRHDGGAAVTVPLRYAGEASRFRATLDVGRSGDYEVLVTAHDPANGNTGLHRVRFTVR